MKNTGIKVTKEHFEKLKVVASRGWSPGEPIMVFSAGEGLRKNRATWDARKICHQLALDYGLPEIPGYYGVDNDGEFVQT